MSVKHHGLSNEQVEIVRILFLPLGTFVMQSMALEIRSPGLWSEAKGCYQGE